MLQAKLLLINIVLICYVNVNILSCQLAKYFLTA